MVQYQRQAIYTKTDIIAVADHAGSSFFAPNTMRVLNSRVCETVWALDTYEAKPGNRYVFITSEKYGDAPRHYAVRMMTLGTVRDDRPWADIETVGEHHATMAQAKKAAQTLHDRKQGLE